MTDDLEVIAKLSKAIGTNTEAIGVLTGIVRAQTGDIQVLHERVTELEHGRSWWQRVFGGSAATAPSESEKGDRDG